MMFFVLLTTGNPPWRKFYLCTFSPFNLFILRQGLLLVVLDFLQEKLEALQKRRIEERMTQRHRRGGRWARQVASLVRSGGATDSLDAMHDLAQQLLKKGPETNEEDMEEGEEDEEGWIRVKREYMSFDCQGVLRR